MARGKKTGGRDFKPGKSGNPAGREPLPEDIKQLRKLTQVEFERSSNKFLFMNSQEITQELGKPECVLLDKIVGSIAVAAFEKSDQQRMEFFLNRLIGKVQDRLEVTTPKPFIITKLDGSQVICGAEVEKEDD